MWNFIKGHKKLFSGIFTSAILVTLLSVFVPRIEFSKDAKGKDVITIGAYEVSAT